MEKESLRLEEFCEKARQAEIALIALSNMLPEAGPDILHNADPGGIRQALAQARAIRAPFDHFLQRFEPFDKAASKRLIEYEASFSKPAQEPPYLAAESAKLARKGTPKYEQLKALPGWPVLINPEAAAQEYGLAIEIYYTDQTTRPAYGSFDQKAFILRGKFEKWAKKKSSALHHLCIALSEFQRPSDSTYGGRANKRALAELIQDKAQEYQQLENLVIEAIQEAAEER